jgi:2-(1,2-epoxy-1,2-dihydrophenyl)acetyl-CoA isomerase
MADLLQTRREGVLTLTLNRPERMNALSDEMLSLLAEALQAATTDETVGAIILTGAGRGFCAGGDVKAMAASSPLPFEVYLERLRSKQQVVPLMRRCPKPVIGAINGAAFGAGLGIALACDLRLAGQSARFGAAFAGVGLSGDFGGTYHLTQLIGPARAREFYMLGEPMDAAAAAALGVVTRVVEDAVLQEEAMALAQRLAAGPRAALGFMKRNLLAAETSSLQEVLDLEALHQTRSAMTEDHHEARRAFVEKRKPVFKGR